MSILKNGQDQIGQISWELPFALGMAVGAAIVIVLGWRALQEGVASEGAFDEREIKVR